MNREEQHISQEMLAYGICSVSNLSRIENGTQAPSRVTYEALMQRMGLSPEIYPSFLDDRELEAFRLKHAINQRFIAADYREAEILCDKLFNMSGLERVHRQFVLYCRALLLREKGGSPEEVLAAMKAVVGLSVKDFEPKKILRHVLTRDELSMLNNLAISFYYAGKPDEGIDMLYALKAYVEKKVADREGIAYMYTAIVYNLSKWVGLAGWYTECIRICDLGIQDCIEYGAYFSFASLLYNKGWVLVKLGRKEEAQKYLQESYYIDRARNQWESCEITQKLADLNGIFI